MDKKDLKEIRGVVSQEIDKFAVIVAKGFDSIQDKLEEHDKRFDEHDKRFESIDKRFDEHDKRFDANDSSHRNINARLDLIETDLAALKDLPEEIRSIRRVLDEVITRAEFNKLEKRLLKVEQQLGLAK